jgi:CheY-like chemotaxis protein
MATILVVDDEPVIRDLVAAIVRSAGHRAMTAVNGLEGVAVFRSHAAHIDLVITDMTMPVLNGAEAVAGIRETRADVPVICMSGYTAAEIPADVLFLPKPFTPADLLSRVAEALA